MHILEEVLGYTETPDQEPTLSILTSVAKHSADTRLLYEIWKHAVSLPESMTFCCSIVEALVYNPLTPIALWEDIGMKGYAAALSNKNLFNREAILRQVARAISDELTMFGHLMKWISVLDEDDLPVMLTVLLVKGNANVITEFCRAVKLSSACLDMLVGTPYLTSEIAKTLLNSPNCPDRLLRTALGIEQEMGNPELFNLISQLHTNSQGRWEILSQYKDRPDFEELLVGHLSGDMDTLIRMISNYPYITELYDYPGICKLILDTDANGMAFGNHTAIPRWILYKVLAAIPDVETLEQSIKANVLPREDHISPTDVCGHLFTNRVLTPELVEKYFADTKSCYLRPYMQSWGADRLLRDVPLTPKVLLNWLKVKEKEYPIAANSYNRRCSGAFYRDLCGLITQGFEWERLGTTDVLSFIFNLLSRTNETRTKVLLLADTRLPIEYVKRSTKSKDPDVSAQAMSALTKRGFAHAHRVRTAVAH